MATDTQVTESGETETKLKRGITPMLLFFFIVGDTLGAGIYTLVGRWPRTSEAPSGCP